MSVASIVAHAKVRRTHREAVARVAQKDVSRLRQQG